jgi:membrane-associated phospholipid phosphatase
MNAQLDFAAWLQSFHGLVPVMKVLSFLGNEEFFLLLLPLVYLSFDARRGARLGALLLFGDAFCSLFKLAFHAPRPYWMDARLAPLSLETSYGLPSSHAQNAAAVWPFLLKTPRRPLMLLCAALLVFGIALSRVYLGAHFVTDVLGGVILGVLWLLIFLKFSPRVEAWAKTRDLKTQIGAALGVAILLFFLGVAVKLGVASTRDALAWQKFTNGEARSLAALAARCGALFGLGAGVVLMRKFAPFDARGAASTRILRFVVGVFVLLLLWAGLSKMFPGGESAVALFLRALRYALMTLWIAFLAPLLFLRLGLAQRRDKIEA